MTSSAGHPTARTAIALRGPWWFREVRPAAGGDGADPSPPRAVAWMPATVPGTVHTDLFANGVIGDPFYGENEKHQQWVDQTGWEYKTSFPASEALLRRGRVELVCAGLDTYADVVLNGATVLRANNMFRAWRVEVRPLLREGENELFVRFRSPLAEVREAYDRLGYVLPAVNDQGTPMLSMFTRKAPYHYGWDWGPRFVTCGIWRPIRLDAWDDARIDDLHVVQRTLTDERADLDVRLTVVAARAARGRVAVRVFTACGDLAATGEANADLAPGPNRIDATLAIARPRLWWPNGLGEAVLYRVEAALSVDRARDDRSVRIGLRTVEVVHRRDAGGKSFSVHVNGAPAFMKGANYIPSDSFLPRVSDARYGRLLRSAAEANMNMLRVWGGGVYEDDRFYDLCDELGILVWQDFMFACSMYPGDDDFVENVRHEAVENVQRLRNHPCLALWAGNNEIEVAWKKWGWQKKFALSESAQQKIWADYARVFHELLPAIVAEEDPSRFYTRSSPSANDDAIEPDTLGHGDMHYWGVWHAEEPYTKYSDHVSRFMSEYGFQSFPELATVSSYAPPSDFRIDSPALLAHQRHPRGNELIQQYMARDFRSPKDFDSFLYLSQLLQAMIIEYAAHAHRRKMPYNGGSLYWQLDDCWPVASWSGIDYHGRWKALHYFARRFFAPVLVSAVAEQGTLSVHVVSDRRRETAARLALRLVDFEGRELWRRDSDERLEANGSSARFTAPEPALLRGAPPDRVAFVAEVFEGGRRLSRALHFFAKPKDLALADPTLAVETALEAGRRGARVRARRLARGVRLTAAGSEATFSDNYFDLLPGESVEIEWAGADAAAISATSLWDTYEHEP